MQAGTLMLVQIGLFASLTAASGFIRIPFFPVPFTLQTVFVYLSGNLLSRSNAVWSQLVFLCIGLAGIPVFSSGGGVGYVLHPTFGYLAAFPVSVFIMGTIKKGWKDGAPFHKWVFLDLAGMGLILTLGAAGLYLNLHEIAGQPFTWFQAFWSGALIFLPAELMKIGLAVALTIRLYPILGD